MLDPRIERMLQETEQQSSLSPGAAKDLREAVESSPYLVEVMTKAIDNGDLEHIRFAHTHNEGGHYNHAEKTISVNADVLQRPARSERIDQLTGVLGHETGHALMARSNEISTYKLSYRIDEALKEGARYGDATVDITPLAKDYINASRENEALAELVSMNSVASRVKHQDPNVTDAELLHRLDPTTPCVTNGRLAQGIQMDAQGIQHTDNRIDSPAISAVAICQFDQSGKGLGTLGRSDYNAYYLSYAVSAGAAVSRDLDRASSQPIPSLGLNLKELGASAEEIQAAGVSLGGQGKTFGFTDTSGRQLRPSEVRQVGKGDAGQPDLAPQPISRDQAVLADSPAHPDHSTYQQIHSWVRGTGNWNDEETRNVSAALYKQQVDDPLLKRVDRVTGGLGNDGAQNVVAIYAPHGVDKAPQFHAHVDGREASQQPAQQNLQQAEVIKQDQVRQQQVEQTQQQTAQQEQGPTMTRGGP
ncbi:XVIPCD domain-containing protein [Xanthomonas campestris pv. campestris]|uniref:XVIPCD domain-containing protein n=1 Tax=Xanthomonas campestris TaxID=339 RepID=UPI001614D115|nr:XVIPCD domain-containing protein [Xanthomonas campestris]MEB1200189.1 XVIPCD domain-containing protein [Xanthomonas campestris pv. campestris]MEA9535307.1 XVIPCD domain-containing protein [Xanthomonas campestris]MEB1270675.1 XVIPCD domain-containing protein [Xanthomonas campestris pv. campestris]MEB1283205.1 XVIPCD domain-containing protein [Xanthomonas campestris pv. campestris]MEB1345612.1 XVIPCD domain-containing protein [Xanthomonas campestris pv. campestris]